MTEADLFRAYGCNPQPAPLDFERPTGTSIRRQCWRAECRAENRDYQTIQQWPNGLVVAWCHRAIYSARDGLEWRAEAFAHADSAPEVTV